MNFTIIDTESAYRRLLDAPDAATREAIYRQELVEPFAGLVQRFGGGDGLEMFARWNMSPEQFADGNREHMRQVLDTLAAHDAWGQAARALDDAKAAFAPYADRIPLGDVTFALMLADLGNIPFQRGYTGFGGMPGYIMTVYGDPDPYNLTRIKGATVHELHHNILGSMSSKNFLTEVTVADYMVMEGLAESFSTELYGDDVVGFFVEDFDYSRMDEAKRIMREGLHVTGFNRIRGYIFGGPLAAAHGFGAGDLPAFAGYVLGYEVVQAYKKRTGKSVVEATFVPADEIIEESEYFS
jgi:uncharacterized protein YjaZ